jgi:hypothetical protein
MIPTRLFWLSALFSPVILAACEGIDSYTKCRVTDVAGYWNEYIEDVDVRDPNRCPFPIDQGRTKLQTYYGVVTAVYPGGAGAGDYLETRIYNSLLRQVGTEDFSSFAGLPPRAEGLIDYTAGTGSSATATTGYDEANNVLRNFGGGWVGEADVELTISYNVNANIMAPTYVTGGSWIQVSANASNHRTPLRYKWWRNGTLLSVTGSSFSTNGPTTGSSTTYKVEITDYDGDRGTDSHTVTASSTSGGGGGGGGGTCSTKPKRIGTDMEACPDPK